MNYFILRRDFVSAINQSIAYMQTLIYNTLTNIKI